MIIYLVEDHVVPAVLCCVVLCCVVLCCVVLCCDCTLYLAFLRAQHIEQQQMGLMHLISVIKEDVEDLKTIEQGLSENLTTVVRG